MKESRQRGNLTYVPKISDSETKLFLDVSIKEGGLASVNGRA